MVAERIVPSFEDYQKEQRKYEISDFLSNYSSRAEAIEALNQLVDQYGHDQLTRLSHDEIEEVRQIGLVYIDRYFPEEKPSLRNKIFGTNGIITRSFLGTISRGVSSLAERRDLRPNDDEGDIDSKINQLNHTLKVYEKKDALVDEQEKLAFISLTQEIREALAEAKSIEHSASYHYERTGMMSAREYKNSISRVDKVRSIQKRKRRLDLRFFGKYIEFY